MCCSSADPCRNEAAAQRIQQGSCQDTICLRKQAILLFCPGPAPEKDTRSNMLRGFPQRLWAVTTKYELANPINVIEHHMHVSVTLTSATRMPLSPTNKITFEKADGSQNTDMKVMLNHNDGLSQGIVCHCSRTPRRCSEHGASPVHPLKSWTRANADKALE